MLGPVVVDLAGTELSPAETELLQDPYVGGLILFGRNCENPAQVDRLVTRVRAVREDLVIAIDQEGGRVQRLRNGLTRLPPLQKLGQCYLRDPVMAAPIIRSCAWLMASEMLSVGVDISFAPVLDADDGFSEVIGDRSFSRDTNVVDAVGSLYLDGMAEAGMAATGKHFPGHGAVKADSHHALPVDERELDAVWSADMHPFRALLPRLAAVMPAHILFKNIDPRPVGCSGFWLQQLLRERLNFAGVIFSDDLSMAGAAFAGSYSERAVAALEAGCDAVLVCNQPSEAAEVLAHLAKLQWPIDNKLASMRPSLEVRPSLAQLRGSRRWQKAQEHLAVLEAIQ